MKNQDNTRSISGRIVLILCPFSLILVSSLCEKLPLARRTVPFEDVRLNEILNAEFLFSRHFKTTLADCTHKCLLTPACFSINFCESGKCELNSEDAHSENAVLEEASLCRYLGLAIRERMNCEEEGTRIFVERNPYQSRCKLAGKQHKTTWGEWLHFVEIDTSEEWKKCQQRYCKGSTYHSTLSCNGKFSEVEIIEWYRFVHERKNWDEANGNCRDLGGKLFSNLNGTVSQLEFLHNKLGSCGWIGGRKTDNAWRNDDDVVIPSEKIIWALDEPRRDHMYVCDGEMMARLKTYERPSVCDLLI